MSYTKHIGTNGETITAAKLNNIENGIEAGSSGGSGLGFVVVTADNTVIESPINFTGQELYDASFTSIVALVNNGEYSGDTYTNCGTEINFIDSCYYDEYNYPDYPYCVTFGNQARFFNCASPDEIPCGYHN